MNETTKYQYILEQYPIYMTKDQMYRICHISKKTCLYLLERGLVPCLDSGKKTRRFKIKTTDVIHYLEDRDIHSEFYKPPEGYYKQPLISQPRALSEHDLLAMRQFYEKELASWQDVMTIKQVSDFTGYGKTSVERWCSKQYSNMVKGVIVPYFKAKKISLGDLKATDIQAFYMDQLKRVSASSVIHYHANIHKALKYAVKIDLIPTNPADKVERPKKNRFIGSFYDSDEVQKLFTSAKGTRLEIPIFLGAFYGLRRSEALGLKWSAIDFQNDTITIRHTVTSCNLDGKHVQIAQDTTKTKSSMRTLPLVPAFKEKLLAHKKQQDEYRRVCGKCYDKRYLDYICVDEMGTLISPHYLTSAFPKLLDKNGLRHIRFHDLRHSCASLLLSNGVPMKQIQEWLGHSDFSTTANVYAHLDYNSKLSSADAMVNGLKGALSAIQ